MNDILKSILYDFASGSQELNEKILIYLSKKRSRNSLIKSLELFKNNFPNFQIIQLNLKRIERYLRNHSIIETRIFIKKILLEYETSIEKIFRKIEKIIQDNNTILTFSNSKTIRDVLLKLSKNKSLKVLVMESNPGGEGKYLYESLIHHGVKAKLIKDSKLILAVKKCNLVFIGADKIIDKFYFINKIGTSKITRASRIYNKPVILLALKKKIIKNYSLEKIKISSARRKENLLFEKIKISEVNYIIHD